MRAFLRRPSARLALAAVLGLPALLSCDSPSGSHEPGAPARVEVVSGDEQAGTVAQPLPQPLVVRVVDEAGRPVPGQVVSFVVVSGGGSVRVGAGTTTAEGIAQDRWTLGTAAADSQRVEVRTVDNAAGNVVVSRRFRATALPGTPAALAKAEGDDQQGTVGDPLPAAAAVRVADAHGNPVPGATVTWTLAPGGGSTAAPASQTDASGVARMAWTLGSAPGTYFLNASAPGVAAPVTFSARAAAGGVAAVRVQPDSARLASIGQTSQLQAAAEDRFGNPLATALAWTSLDVGIATVDASGLVRAVSNGVARIVATSGPRADTVPVTVRQVAVSVAIAPDTVVLLPGDTIRLGARAGDANGFTIGDATFAWTSSDPSVATVGADGLVRVLAQGTARITATAQQPAPAAGRSDLISSPVVSVGAWGGNLCFALATGDAFCRGANGRGQLGDSTLVDRPSPVRVVGGIRFASVDRRFTTSCGLTPDGVAYCWGDDQYGQAGVDIVYEGPACPPSDVSCRPRPVVTSDRFTVLSPGFRHSCGVTTAGALRCWGQSPGGTDPAPGTTFTHVSAGYQYTCAVAGDGRGYCWGAGTLGQTGTGPWDNTTSPVELPGGLRWRLVRAGQHFTCGLTTAGAAYCWGGQSPSVPEPVQGGIPFTDVAVASGSACGIDAAGALWCWNGSGQPSRDPDAPAFARLSGSCGITPGGELYCRETGGWRRVTVR